MSERLADDVVLSSRVRLARNYKDIPFPSMMNDVWAAETIRRTSDAVAALPDAAGYSFVRLADLSKLQRQEMVERHIISRDLLRSADMAAVLLGREDTVSIMVNEEDHIRLQVLLPGADVERAVQVAREVDDALEARVNYAFDDQLGYLTACPTNTGSGMRASQMLHLPALTLQRQMGAVGQAVDKLGLTIRGLYGEGSEAGGDLYQISNQVTLGRTEEELAQAVRETGSQLADMERRARKMLLVKDRTGLEDRLMRSVGVMRYARRLGEKEFMQRWSDVRLAASLGLVRVDMQALDQLLHSAQDGSVACRAGREMSAQERDEVRAQYVRAALGAK